MKKAKSAARKSEAKVSNSEYIFLRMDDMDTIKELSYPKQIKANRMFINTIKQLMTLHNALVDSKASLAPSNQRAAILAMAVLEKIADQKIVSMNEWLDKELENVRSKNPKKKKSKVTSKKNSKKASAKKSR